MAGLSLCLVGAMTSATAASSHTTPAPTDARHTQIAGPVSLHVGAPSWPTPRSTGPRTAPTRTSGSLTSSRTGQVISGLTVNGRLTIRHDNVTVRDVIVNGTGTYMLQVLRTASGRCPTNVRIEYTEINGANASESDIPLYSPHCGYIFDHGHIHNVGRSSRLVNNTTISNSYIFSDRTGSSGSHRGAVGINGGSNNRIVNNVLMCQGTGCSAAIPMYGDFGPVDGLLVQHNLLATTGSYCAYGGSIDSKPYPNGSYIRFINNHFSTKYFNTCGRYGPISGFENGVRGNVWSGNIWHESGRALRVDGTSVPVDALFGISSGGSLYRYPGNGLGGFKARQLVGNNWRVMSLVTGIGDLSGDGFPDIVARDSSARLWLYYGTRTGDVGSRILLGGGWQVMNALVGVGDLSGDGRPDLVARDTAGRLWLYPGTASGRLGSRTQIGHGWTIMTALVGPGDVNSDGRVDLVARSRDGTLYLYLGTASGGLSHRQQTGVAWNVFNAIVAPGDISGDGFPDLIGQRPDGVLLLYSSNGHGGWRSLGQVGHGWSSYSIFGPGAT